MERRVERAAQPERAEQEAAGRECFHQLSPSAGYQERPKNQCVSEDSGFQTGDHDLLDSDEINQLVKISLLSE